MISSLLEIPAVRRRTLPMTVEQYHDLAAAGLIVENAELLKGIVAGKMPKLPLHGSIFMLWLERLQGFCGEKYQVRPEQPITCRRSEPELDLAVVAVSPGRYATGHPRTAELVIEIAVSGEEVDRRKGAIYAEACVTEYWMVLPETRQIEVRSDVSETGYGVVAVFGDGETARSVVLPEFQVEVSGLFPV